MANNKALQRPNQPQKNTANQKPKPAKGGGKGKGNHPRDNNNREDNNNPKPSPWLDPDNEPQPDNSASFVEYLRWMRSPESAYKDGTKVEILDKAQTHTDYRQRLQQCNDRIRRIAGKDNTFTVTTTWRVRVGGHRGPENILLPAFDHLGMPYLPSSTLRGVARTQAIREIMAHQGIDWKTAEERVAPYFGSINTSNPANQAGKVVFLDAYPVPSKNPGLAMDMTNNIWGWENNELAYDPNPNPFFSLKEAQFLVGLRLASTCKDRQILEQVKQWLLQGLEAGVGSQVNTGYGQLKTHQNRSNNHEFLRVSFGLEGQLIHGGQKFNQWNWNDRRQEWQMRGNPQAEVRPVAFKSMLRYWFRAFALGVLSPEQVQEWEARLFGGINPQKRGYLQVRIENGKLEKPEPRPNKDGKNDDCGKQSGVLVLGFSSEIPEADKPIARSLLEPLTWMMFQLGGIGQGARRPCYSRQTRQRAPWFRGATFLAGDEAFWEDIPEEITQFRNRFREKLKAFYSALGELTGQTINDQSPLKSGQVQKENWQEAVDQNCEIVVCSGDSDSNKPFALDVLHSDDLKFGGDYDGFLCGKVRRGVKPSPVWIADLDDFQVVTVFGATANPRKTYLQKLRDRADRCLSIFPLK